MPVMLKFKPSLVGLALQPQDLAEVLRDGEFQFPEELAP